MTTTASSEVAAEVDVAALSDVEVMQLRPLLAEDQDAKLRLGTLFRAQATVLLVVRRPG